jgi:hypothetical protein
MMQVMSLAKNRLVLVALALVRLLRPRYVVFEQVRI